MNLMTEGQPIVRNSQPNIGYICTRLQCELGRGEKVAFRFLTPSLERVDFTFHQLDQESSRYANLLAGLGIGAGEVVCTFLPRLPVCPGSMGKPIQGVEAVVTREDGSPAADGEQGNLCLKPAFPSLFASYLNHPEVYEQKFRHGYYFTGDTAYRDGNGYLWFMGRSDDVINTAGHLVSPFEVESALLEIPEIGESGVIGAPDEQLFEKVVAFISLKENVTWSRELELKIRLYVSNRVSTMATPQDFRIVPSIPKNKSGKIMRRVLKAWYSGADAGDISTLDV